MSQPTHSHLLFVYGTLKRGHSNHEYLKGQRFVSDATTAPGYALYEVGGYPGMVHDRTAVEPVAGELWSVDTTCLQLLDLFEGVAEGLYRREPVRLHPPHDHVAAEAYVYACSVEGRDRLGTSW